MNWTQLKSLRSFSASFNYFWGELPELPAEHLQQLDLSHNRLSGSLEPLVKSFCTSPGGILREIHLNHNDLTGQLPACFMQFASLKRLSLNNNRLQGEIPAVKAANLVVLTLHHNELSGNLPVSLQDLKHLAGLTLHENVLDGSVTALKLTAPCIDNNRLTFRGMGCGVLSLIKKPANFTCKMWEGPGQQGAHLTSAERVLVEENCPELCNTCENFVGHNFSSKATFHHNRFSCELPQSIQSVNSSSLFATVVMGNMVGNGGRLNVSWISEAENFSFL